MPSGRQRTVTLYLNALCSFSCPMPINPSRWEAVHRTTVRRAHRSRCRLCSGSTSRSNPVNGAETTGQRREREESAFHEPKEEGITRWQMRGNPDPPIVRGSQDSRSTNFMRCYTDDVIGGILGVTGNPSPMLAPAGSKGCLVIHRDDRLKNLSRGRKIVPTLFRPISRVHLVSGFALHIYASSW